MPRRRAVVELVDSEDDSWLNQPKFMLSESDSDSDDVDSGIGVAYMEAVAAMKRVNCVTDLKPKLLVSRSCNKSTCCLSGHTFQMHSQLVTKAGHREFTGVLTKASLAVHSCMQTYCPVIYKAPFH